MTGRRPNWVDCGGDGGDGGTHEDGAPAQRDWDRAQSHIVGVSLMVGLTVLALGGLTVAIGTVVDDSASAAEADRVAGAMEIVAEPGEIVGTAEAELRFGDGRLRTGNRSIRAIDADNDSVVRRVDSDVLIYTVDDHVVIGGNGAVLQASDGGATMVTEPSFVADHRSDGPLLLGVPEIDASETTVSTTAASRVTLRATVDHRREDLGERRVRVAVETQYPDTWADYLERSGAAVINRSRQFSGDEHPSVVAEYPGERQTYLVVHYAVLEVEP